MVDATGDNPLAEFPTALDAVEAAVEIQKVLKARNSGLPDDRRMEFRIGVHLGDVTVEDERIYGDGVNIAARLQGREPGILRWYIQRGLPRAERARSERGGGKLETLNRVS